MIKACFFTGYIPAWAVSANRSPKKILKLVNIIHPTISNNSKASLPSVGAATAVSVWGVSGVAIFAKVRNN